MPTYLSTVNYVADAETGLALTTIQQDEKADGTYTVKKGRRYRSGKYETDLVLTVNKRADLPTQTALSLISAKEVIVNRGGDSENEGTVLAHNAVLQADNLTHTG